MYKGLAVFRVFLDFCAECGTFIGCLIIVFAINSLGFLMQMLWLLYDITVNAAFIIRRLDL